MRRSNVIKLEQAQYKIETGVPMPPGTVRHNFPLRLMEVGDSFLIPAHTEGSLRQAVHRLRRTVDIRFACRREGDSVRVWRVS